ncbi:MAG TPA: citrate/2-methylcitrate synthase, partial [Dissulfurispiraceae bacterium]|nr:citrate/2-methylcitrate synthase [Dissulfurispiraceae bacterium]
MSEEVKFKNVGLRGITVADTKISFIDGEQGILIYRGYRIEDLAEKSTFEETAYLLLHGLLPSDAQLKEFSSQLAGAREVPAFVTESLSKWPRDAHPMDVLQASIPILAMTDPDLHNDSRDANMRKAVRIIARLPVLVAAWHRIRNGLEPLRPDGSLSHAGNFLWLLHGTEPDELAARGLDVCLILHADHTFNA